MTLSGGKRKVNKSLKAWVSFVKKVQKEEKLSYKDAIHRAKVRKDKGEKWMSGGTNDANANAMEVDPEPTAEPNTNEQMNNNMPVPGMPPLVRQGPRNDLVTALQLATGPNQGNVGPNQGNVGPNQGNVGPNQEGGKHRRRTMRRSRGRGRGRSRGRGKSRSRGKY
jgi:hypothetical protein